MRLLGRPILVAFAFVVFMLCRCSQGYAAEPASKAATMPTSAAMSQPTGELALDLGNKTTMKLVLVPAGEFLMGSPIDEPDRQIDERLQRKVTISKPFYMGINEVTQEQYRVVTGSSPSHFSGSNNPVEQVSWDDAMEFCKLLSIKTGKAVYLPTEAQWEYACRAGTTTPFNTGETITTDQANFNGSSISINGQRGEYRQMTLPVGSFKPNAFGLYDMHGNVWEWCSDWYDEKYYLDANRTDPKGPASGMYRVLRGGGWIGNRGSCRSSLYGGREPLSKSSYVGFRVCVDPAQQAPEAASTTSKQASR